MKKNDIAMCRKFSATETTNNNTKHSSIHILTHLARKYIKSHTNFKADGFTFNIFQQ